VTAETVAVETVDGEVTDAEFLRWLGRRIRVLRVNRGMSQDQLAAAARMSRNFVSSIERGAHGVEVLRLRRLAAAVGVSLVTLIDPGVESGSLALSASAGSRGQVASIGRGLG
jgi:transcriptional regulator with XRE-family HTH domain